jgi:hypothetical protein
MGAATTPPNTPNNTPVIISILGLALLIAYFLYLANEIL